MLIISTGTLSKEMSEESLFVIDYVHCVKKEVLCPRRICTISEGVRKSLHRCVKAYWIVHSLDCKSEKKKTFLSQLSLSHISNTLSIYFLLLSKWQMTSHIRYTATYTYTYLLMSILSVSPIYLILTSGVNIDILFMTVWL